MIQEKILFFLVVLVVVVVAVVVLVGIFLLLQTSRGGGSPKQSQKIRHSLYNICPICMLHPCVISISKEQFKIAAQRNF